ncbi:PREDICTED: uncharacterized protein LOC105140257 isoform X1 [Populus euphratica]|uniref:Uncharacterized protein LOC105140257 isoform X1 n=1 Tax=Populus euphratica TaxID=75702 RepID=A0AAJ6VD32_POPEU|nr:PREDICTED: uncharacterized protein LOC105140257 isoform X1 [Populus euphratica]XP_011045316.1 PREDICTED: uncharacterized protein LOC105140257 isoform X1 [Populus euphratica]XP_011045317.1 PREDICTED: uncharacterized protein LOC105140257 isoform X1 [Populus euphratica]
MPSFKMKTNLNMSSIRETNCLSVCQKSNVISKKSYSHVPVSQQPEEFDKCVQKCQDGHVASTKEIYTEEGDIKNNEAIDLQDLPHDGNSQFLKQLPISVDSGTTGDIESIYNFASNVETIFSPVLEPIEVLSVPNISDGAGNNNDLYVPGLGPDDSDYNRSSCDYQTCNISDFFISDMIIASLPFGESAVVNDFTDVNPFLDYKCAEPSMLFDVAEECMILPFLKDTAKVSDSNDMKSSEEAMIDSDNSGLYLAINQIRTCDQESDLMTDSDQSEDFDPQFFIRNLPELSDVVSNFRPSISPKEPCRRKSITLVLDLDETLVHSTLEHCDDVDFTFTVFFNMKEHRVYVKQRPHVHTFLERVAEMFEVVIFTASQSIYAAQLLDMLDPDRKLISRRFYRESCIFSDGSYTKDLTVLGVDLAKVAIIDNSPQVFRLQVNNGIPIKSWFSDPSDCALISLLPFLETLVDADDVRPIIAKRFGHLRKHTRLSANGKYRYVGLFCYFFPSLCRYQNLLKNGLC